MTNHTTKWLQAYLDNELQSKQQEKVNAHLAGCLACRAELETLQALGALLQESPPPSSQKSAEVFTSEVLRQLPRREETSAWQRALRFLWKMFPVGLLGMMLLMITTWITSEILQLGQRLDLWEISFPALVPALQGSEWTQIIRQAFCILTGVCTLEGLLPTGVLLATGTVLLYLSWLASWYARQRHHQQQPVHHR